MLCAACKGVAHPVTGCQYSERVLICRGCTVRFWVWLRQHTNGKGRRRGPNFYDHVRPCADGVPETAITAGSADTDSGSEDGKTG